VRRQTTYTMDIHLVQSGRPWRTNLFSAQTERNQDFVFILRVGRSVSKPMYIGDVQKC